jgi:hypothetical protein
MKANHPWSDALGALADVLVCHQNVTRERGNFTKNAKSGHCCITYTFEMQLHRGFSRASMQTRAVFCRSVIDKCRASEPTQTELSCVYRIRKVEPNM